MSNSNLRSFLNFTFFVTLSISCVFAQSATHEESKTVAQARELVDTYYGNQRNLTKAAELLERAFKVNPNDSNVYVQAARITIMGGHLRFDDYEAGSFERYGSLLDKAIALNGSNATAHILKAQVFQRQRRRGEQFAELNKAKAIGTYEPWLAFALGQYYQDINLEDEALKKFSEIEKRGPGGTAAERKVYIFALNKLSMIRVPEENYDARLRRYAEIALKERYPTDAWTPHGFAETFIDYKLFQDAIFYAREALKTMDFGAGRLTLAAALYAQAARLHDMGASKSDYESYVNEASKFNFSQSDIIEYLVFRRGSNGNLDFLTPTLKELIP